MFWTDWGASAKIESAYLNGENRQTIIASPLGWPNDIALDYSSKMIYWVDAQIDKIEYANYNGVGRGHLLLYPGIHPFGVDIYSSWLYWTDWNTQSGLHQMDKSTGSLMGKTQVYGRRMGLVVMDSSRQPSSKSKHTMPVNSRNRFSSSKTHMENKAPRETNDSVNVILKSMSKYTFILLTLSDIATGLISYPFYYCQVPVVVKVTMVVVSFCVFSNQMVTCVLVLMIWSLQLMGNLANYQVRIINGTISRCRGSLEHHNSRSIESSHYSMYSIKD